MNKEIDRKNKRAVIYVRSATAAQGAQSSVTEQEKKCREYCKEQGLKVAGVYRDEGVSGLTRNRQGLDGAIVHCTRGAHVLVVVSPDRLSRNVADYYSIKALLTSAGVSIKSLSEAFTIQHDIRLIFERTTAGA